MRFLNAEQAKIALVTMKEALLTPSLVSWATSEAKVALADGGKLVPLATARPSILRYFESLREALSPAENGARMQLLHRPGLAPMPIRSL